MGPHLGACCSEGGTPVGVQHLWCSKYQLLLLKDFLIAVFKLNSAPTQHMLFGLTHRNVTVNPKLMLL